LPDLEGPLSEEVLTISIIDAIVIKVGFCCACDTKYGNPKAFANI